MSVDPETHPDIPEEIKELLDQWAVCKAWGITPAELEDLPERHMLVARAGLAFERAHEQAAERRR